MWRTTLIACCLAALGCGDNLGPPGIAVGDCQPVEIDPSTICHEVDAPIAAGEFRSSADFDLSGCDPGSLDGVDLSGIYESASGKFALSACSGGYAVRGHRPVRQADMQLHQDSNGLLIRSASEFFVQATLVCADNGDGTYVAKQGRCSAGQCLEVAADISPFQFNRPNGEDPASGLELVAEHALDRCGERWPVSEFVSHIERHDDRVYVSVSGSALHIVDVADPSEPKTLGTIHEPDSAYNDIALFERDGSLYAIVANAGDMPIYDVSQPGALFEVARIESGAHRLDVLEVDGGVFVYAAGGAVTIHDISDPRAPVLVATALEGADAHAPVATADALYVAAGTDGFVVMNDPRTDPSATIHGVYTATEFDYSHHAGLFEVDGVTYALHNDEAGLERWFKILDVTPGSPQFLQVQSEYRTTEEQPSHNITMSGTKAILSYYEHGVRVLDVSDPRAPQESAYFHTFDPSIASLGVDGAVDTAYDAERGLVFVAESPRGLLILREN